MSAGPDGVVCPMEELLPTEEESEMLHRMMIGAAAACALAAGSAAGAYPVYGTFVEGDCSACHDDEISTDRFETFDFIGQIDPPGGIGQLNYFTVQAGNDVSIGVRALDGEEDYAFVVRGTDDPSIEGDGPLLFEPTTPEFIDYGPLSDVRYFAAADGDTDGYDWLTTDPTELTFDMAINLATPPGYYVISTSLSGRDPSRAGWYQEELVYLEVTANPAVFSLEATQLVRGQRATLQATGATANRPVYFVYSLSGYGNTFVPQLGIALALENPVLGAQGQANGSGTATVQVPIPASIPPVTVYLQAAQPNRASDVEVRQVQ